jgi:hypothetical protein
MDVTAGLLCWFTVLWYGQVVLTWNEARTNLVQIDDPCFHVFPLRDTSWPVGLLQYLIVGNFLCRWQEWDLDLFMWALMAMILLRCAVLCLHPFKAHDHIIPLVDPVVDFMCKVEQPRKNDLSFSGHCALSMLMGFMLPGWTLWYGAATVVMAFLLVTSRNHYMADCLLAPFVSHACVSMAPFWASQWASLSLLPRLLFCTVPLCLTLRHRSAPPPPPPPPSPTACPKGGSVHCRSGCPA